MQPDAVDSLEMRWFGRGEGPPAEAVVPPSALIEDRLDRYAPTGASCGVKLREGRLEVKVLLATEPAIAVGPVGGTPEVWRKWCFPAEAERLDATARIGWTPVRKHRWLHRRRSGEVEIQLEWARVTACGRRWWTVGLELVGGGAEQRSAEMHASCDELARSGWSRNLSPTACASYPAWLTTTLNVDLSTAAS
jgi:hypothetical protein